MFFCFKDSLTFINTLIKTTYKIKGFIARDIFGLFFIVSLSIGIILLKGSYSEGQVNIFSVFLRQYTEETAAAIIAPSQNQLADINSVIFNEGMANGSNRDKDIGTTTIQQNSLLSYNSLENDLADIQGDLKTEVSYYTVQQGDTISFIAFDFGVSINSIIWANNLKDVDSLKVGMELKIPPVSGVIHIVKKGDTVDTIAKKYSVEAQKIIDFNVLPKDGALQIGAEIIVPDGKIQQPRIYATTPSRFAYLPNLNSYYITPASGFNWGRIHGRNGVDIANSCGTPIYAAADGKVETSDSVGWNGGFGKFIKLSHANGTETVYAHASKLISNLGEFVTKGQLIALMGTTGRSTGCHLHFEVHGAKNPLIKY